MDIFTEMFSECIKGLMENCISQYSANFLIFLQVKLPRKLFYHLISPNHTSHRSYSTFTFLSHKTLQNFSPCLHIHLSLILISPSLPSYFFTKHINLNILSSFCVLHLYLHVLTEKQQNKRSSSTVWLEGGRRKKDKLHWFFNMYIILY